MSSIKRNIDIGDIVKIKGYDDDLFEVVSISSTYYKDYDLEYEITEYETLNLRNKKIYFADDFDVDLIHKKKDKTEDSDESIDDLLDEMNDISNLIKMFGEHEDDKKRDRKYSLRKNEIIAKLKDKTKGCE